jgi:hypothetical protein
MGKPQSVSEYLSALPKAQESTQKPTGHHQSGCACCSGTISSGVPAFRHRGKYLVSFGAATAHVSLFVMRGAALKYLRKSCKVMIRPTQ